MSQMEIDRVLSTIRSIKAQTSSPGAISGGLNPLAGTSGGASSSVSFASVLKGGIDEVNRLQQRARSTVDKFERGVPGVDLPQVMIDMQKSSVAFRGAVEVRNRVVSAYQDIMNMPV
ncbi:MAG: flagellar hook-basal body complex protein FliE [Gammaproteobacteria bacterium]|jgi:flagellar hook-basal body complex protein FliE|nr:flagellar hook-basal body complex protein FliE [Gammaproteobacteria bacterium]